MRGSCTEECENCTGVLIFHEIDAQGFAVYTCAHCGHTERIRVEKPAMPLVPTSSDVDRRLAL